MGSGMPMQRFNLLVFQVRIMPPNKGDVHIHTLNSNIMDYRILKLCSLMKIVIILFLIF